MILYTAARVNRHNGDYLMTARRRRIDAFDLVARNVTWTTLFALALLDRPAAPRVMNEVENAVLRIERGDSMGESLLVGRSHGVTLMKEVR